MSSSARLDAPIGIFDSGVGGLTVARALMARLPHERLFYFGDTARVPYGIKSAETIAHYATQIAEFLLAREVKLLVIACNSVAAVAARTIAELSPVPVLDVIAAGAHAAARATRNRRIGVIGTLATINSAAYERAIHAHDAGIEIHAQACPLFVPLVEEGWLDHEVTRLTAREYLASLIGHGIDTLVLGCTHYPLLKPILIDTVGNGVQLVASAETVARGAAQLLAERGLENPGRESPAHEFFVTDVPQRFQRVGELFLGRPLAPVHVVKW
jgi:glutamate racemase